MQIKRNGPAIEKGRGIYGDISVPDVKRSGFDMSYTNMFNGHLANLYPSFVSFVYPNDSLVLKQGIKVDSLPLVSPLFDNISICAEAFFVPLRMVDPKFRSFITCNAQDTEPNAVIPNYPITISGVASASTTGCPLRHTNSSVFTAGTLMDFLDYTIDMPNTYDSTDITSAAQSAFAQSAYPLLAYWRIIFDWYQNRTLLDLGNGRHYSIMNCFNGYWTNPSSTDKQRHWNIKGEQGMNVQRVISLADDTDYKPSDYVTKPYVRSWERDMFTTAVFSPQSTNVAISSNQFSLESFREAVALDRFARRESLSSVYYADNINAHFGVKPNECCNRSTYLGSFRIPLTNQTITNTSTDSGSQYLGTKASTFYADSANGLINNFTATEHGIVIALVSLNLPRLECGYLQVEWRKNTMPRTEWFFPEFNEMSAWSAITNQDLHYRVNSSRTAIGYNENFRWLKERRNELHGSFTDSTSAVYNRTSYTGQGASATAVQDMQTIPYADIEAKLFADPSGLSTCPPFLFRIDNNCYMVRPLPVHSEPLI